MHVAGSRAMSPDDTQMSLGHALVICWRSKWWLLASGLVFFVAVAAWMKVTSPIYSAEMVVAPPLQLSGGKLDIRSSVEDLSALAGGLGDLSSLASGASGGTKEYRRFLAMITSGAVAERLYQNPDLLHAMLHKSWDEESKSWRQPGPIGQVFRAIDVFFDMPVFDRPTVEHVQKFLESSIAVREDKQSGTALVVARTTKRELGPRLLQAVHAEADSILREAALTRAHEQMEYVQQKLEQVSQTDHRKAMIRLLISNEAQIMFAQANVPYSADVIVAPMSRERPISPSPKLFLFVAGILGVFAAAIVVIALDLMRRPNQAVA